MININKVLNDDDLPHFLFAFERDAWFLIVFFSFHSLFFAFEKIIGFAVIGMPGF